MLGAMKGTISESCDVLWNAGYLSSIRCHEELPTKQKALQFKKRRRVEGRRFVAE
jgi:hypothetical protein